MGINCLVLWNMIFIFPYNGNFRIPTDELIFFRGVGIPPTSRCGKMWKTHCQKSLGNRFEMGEFPYIFGMFTLGYLLIKIDKVTVSYGKSPCLVGNITELNGQFPIVVSLPEGNVFRYEF
jgi:hypothetical protein